MNYQALVTYQQDKQVEAKLEQKEQQSLATGQVRIKVDYSTINYKDALAVTGKGKIQRHFPLVPGIDLAGEVIDSTSADFKQGDKVLINGCGLGESFDGGLQQQAVMDAEHVMPLPAGLTAKQAMILGTAGFTAALAIHRMQQNGQAPDKGSIVVTGATGGVGSLAISILSKLGYDTIAVTSRKQQHQAYLKSLGATEVMSKEELALGNRPLESVKFGGVIDNVGGELLSELIAHTNLWGNVACIGLAASPKLDATVFPLILRGVSLLGVSSTNCPMPLRRELWQRLGDEWRLETLETILKYEIGLEQVEDYSHKLINRELLGRLIVDLTK